jgi:hypothetical protein
MIYTHVFNQGGVVCGALWTRSPWKGAGESATQRGLRPDPGYAERPSR